MGNSSSTEAEEEGTAGFPEEKQLLADTTASTMRDGGHDDHDEGVTFSTKSDTGGSTSMRMTRPSTDGSGQEEKNDIDCPTGKNNE